MTINDNEVRNLITELNVLFGKVQEKREFLSLKQSELHPSNEISFFGFLQAREQLAYETSVLAGHAHMIQEMIATEKLTLDPVSKRLLKEIMTFSRQQIFW